jgi:hypothetical protein
MGFLPAVAADLDPPRTQAPCPHDVVEGLAAFAAEVAPRVRVLELAPEVAADQLGEAVLVDPALGDARARNAS